MYVGIPNGHRLHKMVIFFLVQHTKIGKCSPNGYNIYRMAIKYAKWLDFSWCNIPTLENVYHYLPNGHIIYLPNGHKIHKMRKNMTKLSILGTFKKQGFLVYVQIYQLTIQGSMLWSQFSVIFANLRRKKCFFSKPLSWLIIWINYICISILSKKRRRKYFKNHNIGPWMLWKIFTKNWYQHFKWVWRWRGHIGTRLRDEVYVGIYLHTCCYILRSIWIFCDQSVLFCT
jgi:hypothetical protein